MIENHYKIKLIQRKLRFSPNWDFYSIQANQRFREFFSWKNLL